MGKCKFNEAWMDKISFRHWLKPVADNVFEAYCTVCKKSIQLGTMGVKALDSHTKSTKHMKYVRGKEQTPSITAGFPPASHLAASSTFTCGADKTAYIAKFGLAIHIKDELVSKVNKSLFVLMFDESLNEITKTKQLDVHIRFWDEGHSRYLGSQFMGHSTAQDLLSHLKECMDKLDLRGLVSLSMDGPSVNWKLFDLFQKEQAKQYGGVQLVCVGSCGLHTLHNAFKCGFTAWQLDKLLRAMHTLFHNMPARREDYITVTKSSVFPLSFCAHHSVENLPVVALVVWPSLLLYMEAVKTKKLPNPGTASYDTVEAAMKDPLILAKLQFYTALARTFTPFLKKYQTDEPVLPFLSKDLTELMMSLLRRFIKREVLHDITALQLTKLDVTDKTIWLSPQDISIGLGAESVLKSIKGAELRVLEFRRECMQGLCSIIRKVQDKSPLNYLTVRQMVCLDPSVMYRDPERCRKHMKGLVQRFLQDKQLTDTSAGDVILQQFDILLSLESRSEDFLSFPPMQKRLDLFLSSVLREPYPELWAFCKKLLILSHGQATVERGFSINKEVELDNIQEDTVVTRRLVCDYIMQHGGVTQVPLTIELLASVAAARARYWVHLDTERKKREAEAQALKRKGAEDQLQELRGKRRRLQEVSEGLARDADRLAEEAEGKAGGKMADLITSSNLLRRGHKEKLAELAVLDKEIAAKSAELRS